MFFRTTWINCALASMVVVSALAQRSPYAGTRTINRFRTDPQPQPSIQPTAVISVPTPVVITRVAVESSASATEIFQPSVPAKDGVFKSIDPAQSPLPSHAATLPPIVAPIQPIAETLSPVTRRLSPVTETLLPEHVPLADAPIVPSLFDQRTFREQDLIGTTPSSPLPPPPPPPPLSPFQVNSRKNNRNDFSVSRPVVKPQSPPSATARGSPSFKQTSPPPSNNRNTYDYVSSDYNEYDYDGYDHRVHNPLYNHRAYYH